MFQSVISNYRYSVDDVKKLYIDTLNSIANKIVSNHKYGTNHKIEFITYFKIKRLLPIVNNNCIMNNNTSLINELVETIKG